jgi:hypothetical protein
MVELVLPIFEEKSLCLKEVRMEVMEDEGAISFYEVTVIYGPCFIYDIKNISMRIMAGMA